MLKWIACLTIPNRGNCGNPGRMSRIDFSLSGFPLPFEIKPERFEACLTRSCHKRKGHLARLQDALATLMKSRCGWPALGASGPCAGRSAIAGRGGLAYGLKTLRRLHQRRGLDRLDRTARCSCDGERRGAHVVREIRDEDEVIIAEREIGVDDPSAQFIDHRPNCLQTVLGI